MKSHTPQLILWRHADAEDAAHSARGAPQADFERVLTEKGRAQARLMAKWLRERLPKDARVLTSPARRAVETARALTEDFNEIAELGTDFGPKDLLRAICWPEFSGTLVVVGHQPTLGEAAALLVTGRESGWNVKKGAVWWLGCKTEGGETECAIRAVMSPDLAKD